MNSHSFSRVTTCIVAVLLAFTPLAQAGPPLVCHPISIGQAKSLPWVDLNYRKGSGTYDLKNLTQDTLVILDSNTPVLVHMETLRRATLYARQDPQVAKELLTRLHARAANSNADTLDALAWFDVGYLAETYKQWMGNDEPNPAKGLDGYGWVKKAISRRGSDPEMEFAAALIALAGSESDRKPHVERAMAGAKTDPLLAQNLASFFNRQTIAEMLTHPTGGEFRK
jgi:phage tail protein X